MECSKFLKNLAHGFTFLPSHVCAWNDTWAYLSYLYRIGDVGSFRCIHTRISAFNSYFQAPFTKDTHLHSHFFSLSFSFSFSLSPLLCFFITLPFFLSLSPSIFPSLSIFLSLYFSIFLLSYYCKLSKFHTLSFLFIFHVS